MIGVSACLSYSEIPFAGPIGCLEVGYCDGQINRNASYNIRGTTSINGGSPLVLIDGTPGNLNLIAFHRA